jgi:hypothetical protein
VDFDLEEEYWGEGNPNYPPSDWQTEVVNGDTRQGYWEWLDAKLQSSDLLEPDDELYRTKQKLDRREHDSWAESPY